jgi:hypothetical protein
MRGISRALLLTLGLHCLASFGCAFGLSPAPPPAAWQLVEIRSDAVDELSGLVQSRTHPDVYWAHNDSGDEPRFFALHGNGELISTFRVSGADAEDWEDIAIDDQGFLYLGDFGNNLNKRDDLRVYRVAEPNPFTGNTTVDIDRTLRFRYADQAGAGNHERNFDCESMLWRADSLYLFTKHRSDTMTKLYRLDPLGDPQAEQVLPVLASFDLGGKAARFLGNATGADLRPGDQTLALLSYDGVFFFTWSGAPEALPVMTARLPFDRNVTQQAEAIAWDGSAILVGNEQQRIFRIIDALSLAQPLP